MATLRSGWDGLLPICFGEVPETAFLGKDEETHPPIISDKTRNEMSPQEPKNEKSRARAHACRKARAILKLRFKQTNHRFLGTINLKHLPRSLQILYARDNNLTGTVRVPFHDTSAFHGNTKLTVE